ncbi:MAG: hypothetical protein MJ003_04660 [Paludibacteraceae bacterium]|nr:hypothetical protein [Paludibacteraceae bacterium]
MKKNLLLVMAMLLMSTVAAIAQPRAIGGRIGSGFEFSYQHTVGSNFVSLDAGLIYGVASLCNATANGVHMPDFHGTSGMVGVETVATYNWLFPIKAWKHKGAWNWYAGVGAGIGYMRLHNSNYYGADSGFAGFAGRVGFEYNFWFPLQLSFDYRPIIGPCFDKYSVMYNLTGLYAGAICLGVRYKF